MPCAIPTRPHSHNLEPCMFTINMDHSLNLQEGGYVFLIEEFAGGGDLLNFLFAYGGKVPEGVFVKRIAKPLFSSVHYMHSLGIVHRCAADVPIV